MKIDITYPIREKRKFRMEDITAAAKITFLSASFVCPALNVIAGGKAWSLIVLWSLWIVWSSVFSPDLVEFNRISQFIKSISKIPVLLVMIDVLFAPGKAMWLVPIICLSALAAAGVLFFTDLERQKQNMMPMLLFTAVSILYSAVGMIFLKNESRRLLLLMGIFGFVLLAASFAVLGKGFVREIKKRFHTE